MKAKVIIVMLFHLLFCWIINELKAQVANTYYLPDIAYDKSIPDPQSILGYQVGEWHVTYGQLQHYLNTLCDGSPRCQKTLYAYTHERKALYYYTISSVNNMARLDNIKTQRKALLEGHPECPDTKSLPLVIYHGYSVHGNESSGANASMMVAYYLIAGQSKELDSLRNASVIIIDPCQNPDGFQRFNTWVNSHKHHTLSSDPRGREFNEPWPGGRTNHYWCDLNRDWLYNTHPSSQGRINTFQEWQPDVLTDHHEMGSNSTFFFQPGVPSRVNLNTPAMNQHLTECMSDYHKIELDQLGSKYFSKEKFDDFYYGKGSTYPDANGCVGILFEQASSRGHLKETTNGLLSFPFTIRNQVAVCISTQKGSIALKDSILTYKHNSYVKEANLKGAYVFEKNEGIYEADYFIKLLLRHGINVYVPQDDKEIELLDLDPKKSFIVPKNQTQSRLLKTIFEPVHRFNDSIFYDVSAWTIPYAFNLKYKEISTDLSLGHLISEVSPKTKIGKQDGKVISIDWHQYNAPQALYQLLDAELDVRIIVKKKKWAKKPHLPKGSILISLKENGSDSLSHKEKLALVIDICNKAKINYEVENKRTLWAYSTTYISQPKVAMIVGDGIVSYNAGSHWYQMDKRIEMPCTIIDKHDLGKASLLRYTTLILPDGQYNKMDTALTRKIDKWIAGGGHLIAMQGAIAYTNQQDWTKLIPVQDTMSYDDAKAQRAQRISGAIFNTHIERDHPLFFGYQHNELPVLKKGKTFYNTGPNTRASCMLYTQAPLLSGYTSQVNLGKASGAAGIACFDYGQGKVIAMMDNPNFRGQWLGGSKLFANSLFFSELIEVKKP